MGISPTRAKPIGGCTTAELVRVTRYTRRGLDTRVVLIEAWAWGRNRRQPHGVRPRFYATFFLSVGVARLLLRADTAPPEPAGGAETQEGLS
jgi:hypothetical protein